MHLDDRNFSLCLQYNKSASKCYVAPPPLVVNLESNFKPSVPTSLTFSARNYDGTERHQTVSEQIGCEVVTDLLLGVDGRVLAKTQSRRGKAVYMNLRQIV